MKKRFWIIYLFWGFIVATNQLVLSQLSKSMTIRSIVDDNAFQNYETAQDWITQLAWFVGNDHKLDNWQSRLFYNGYLDLFSKFHERNYHSHQVGLVLARPLTTAENVLNLGISGAFRLNRPVYDYYNFRELSGHANFKMVPGPAGRMNFGYRARTRWYPHLIELNYLEHFLFLRFTHFFPTRTTLILETNYGRKSYHDQNALATSSEHDSMPYGHRRGGRGQIKGWQGNSTKTSGSASTTVSQWLGQIHLAQAIFSNTGLSSALVLRRNPDVGVRYLSGQVSGYTSEDELFDDRYGFESEELSFNLTQRIRGDFTIKAGWQFQWKRYVNRPALDLTGNDIADGSRRQDRRQQIELQLERPLSLFNQTQNLFIEISWLENRSNDLYYDYQASMFAVGLGINL